MANREIRSLLFILCFVVGLLFFASPHNVQAQTQVMGCCQFEGDEGGCWFPANPDACANLHGKYFEDAKCNADVTQCIENKKDDSGSSNADKE